MEWKKESLRLYAITDRSWLKSGQTLAVQVEQALRGGVSMVQLREKQLGKTQSKQDKLMQEILDIQALCRQYQVPFIINDNVELALRLKADGVHLGQEDCSIEEARSRLGADCIIGATAKTIEQALAAQIQGADYLGCGAVFGSMTKMDAKPMELALLRQICETVSIPVVAIGGITLENINLLEGTGIEGVAVISGIFAQPDIEWAAAGLRQVIRRWHVAR